MLIKMSSPTVMLLIYSTLQVTIYVRSANIAARIINHLVFDLGMKIFL